MILKKNLVLVFLFSFLFSFFMPLINADIISINSGGSSNIMINAHKYIEGFFFGEEDEDDQGEDESGGGGTPSAGSAGAGSESDTPSRISGFKLNKDLIKISIKQGETMREVLEVENTGDKVLSINLLKELVEKFMIISEESFYLRPGEVKSINIDFFAKENEIPDAYTGRIIVQGNGIRKIINVIIEVIEKKPLFDIITRVKQDKLIPDYHVKADIEITNMGDLEDIDVVLYYAIKDFEEKILVFREESLAIKKNLKVVGKLRVPGDAELGNYIFYSKVSYGNITATSSDIFKVVEKEEFIKMKIIYWVIPVILVLLIIILIIIIFRKRRRRRPVEYIVPIRRRRRKRRRKRHSKLKHEIKRKINEWKFQGYDTSHLERKLTK